MAVTVQSKEGFTGKELLKALGFTEDDFAQLADYNIDVVVNPTGLMITQHGQTKAKVPLKAGAALFAVQGKLAKSSLQAVYYKVKSAIEEVTIDPLDDAGPMLKNIGTAQDGMPVYKEVHAPEGYEPTFKKPGFKDTILKKKAKAGTLPMLADADTLYQFVSGTTATSKYVVVAMGPSIKIAARQRPHSVSVRAEGDMGMYKGRLKEAGFTNVSDSYASVHLDCHDDVMAARIVGSLLAGLGVEFTTQFPNISLIKGGV